ncbi:MAG TPA: MltA domain-containing protein [Methylomirabilota bacterium]|nr:MltA domain-containing protein [Methylomirabilota bacterium]
MANRRKTFTIWIKLAAVTGILWMFSATTVTGRDLPPAPIVSDDLDRESIRRALRQSQAYLKKLPPDRVVGEQPRRFTAQEVLDSLVAFDRLLDRWDCRECWIKALTQQFELVPSSSDPELQNVLFTGYYDPVIDGSLVPTAEYIYPIYGKPADLLAVEQVMPTPAVTSEKVIGRIEGESFVPYYSRREIDDLGSLRGRGYEIAWVKDPIDLFFLHIQGSGVLRLPDGRQIKVGYAGANGRAYRSIGRLLIDNGKIPREEMSMQRLRRYLTDHPEERSEIMAYNESYVFFRFLEDGPLGSLEVPITPGRSIATDSSLFPKGALAFIFTERPVLDPSGQLIGWTPFLRFVLNQDTGGAIRGPQRVDLYFGTGDPAAASAGYMNSPGKLYFVLLKRSAKNQE